jgi:ribonuclease E
VDENGNPEALPLDNTAGAESQVPQTDENGGERRERRSRDRYGRDRRERGDRAPREEGSAEHADNEQAPQEASDTRAQAQSAAPVAEASARAGMPVVQAFTLPVADMQAVAQGSGLEWINSNPERIAAVQAAIAAEPKPVHVPRERPPLVILDEGPLVLVETRKDL